MRKFLFFVLLFPFLVRGQDGAVDASFGTNGVAKINISTNAAGATALGPTSDLLNLTKMILLPDGKIVQVGYKDNGGTNDFVIIRYNADGTPDNSFGVEGGFTVTDIGGNDRAHSVYFTGYSYIVVGESVDATSKSHIVLVSYDFNGFLSAGFGTGGIVKTTLPYSAAGNALVVRYSGEIVVAGWGKTGATSDFIVLKYNSSGSRIRSDFGQSDGIAVIDFNGGSDDVATDITFSTDSETGLIVVGTARVSTDRFAHTFLSFWRGFVYYKKFSIYNGSGRAVVSNKAGLYYMTGLSNDDFTVAAFSDFDGASLSSFGTSGLARIVTTAVEKSRSIALQCDGKIVVGGDITQASLSTYAMARFTKNGLADNTFGTNGIRQITNAGYSDFNYSGLAIQTDGKLLIGGISFTVSSLTPRFKPSVVRLLNPSLDIKTTVSPQNPVVCYGQSITLTASAPGATYFQWYKYGNKMYGETGNTLTVSESGSYTVKAFPCGSLSSPATVTVKGPKASLSPSLGGLCNGSLTITATAPGAVKYKWFKDNVEIAITTSTNLEVKAEGVYTVQAMDETCSGPVSNKATISGPIVTPSLSGDGVYCNNSKVDVGIPNIVEDQTYLWMGPQSKGPQDGSGGGQSLGFTINSSNFTQYAGEYDVVSTKAGCPDAYSNKVYVGFAEIQNLKVDLLTNAYVDLSWDKVHPTLGKYQYSISTFSQPPQNPGTWTSRDNFYSQNWLTPGTVYYFHVRALCTSGEFGPWRTITFTTSASCPTITFSTEVNQPTCTLPKGSIKIYGATGGAPNNYSFSKDDGATFLYTGYNGITFSDLASGTHKIIVQDASGCKSQMKEIIIVASGPPSQSPSIIATQPTCTEKGSISLTNQLNGLTYNLLKEGVPLSSSNDGIFKNLESGTYFVTANNACGASPPSSSVLITAPPSAPTTPTLQGTITHPSCPSPATGSFTVKTTTSGTINYDLIKEGNIVSSNTNGAFTNVLPGVYSVKATNSCGASAGLSISVNAAPTVPSAPTLQGAVVQPGCGTPGRFTVITNASGVIEYKLYNSNGQVVSTNTTGSFEMATAGTFTATAANSCGVSPASQPINIYEGPTVPEKPTATVTQQPTCSEGGIIRISAPTGSGLSYSIDGTTYSNTSGVFTNLLPGTYKVTAKNNCGISAELTNITVNAPPAAPAKPVASVTKEPTCAQPTGTIEVTSPLGSGYFYSINGTDYSNTSGTFVNVPPGSYNITVKNNCGISQPLSDIRVVAPPGAPPAPLITATQADCSRGGSITVSGPMNNTTYSLAGGTTVVTSATGNFTNLAPGTYTVTATNDCGTSAASNSAKLAAVPSAPSKPEASVVEQPSCTKPTGTIKITAPTGDGISYSINGGGYTNTSGVFDNLAPGTYSITAKNACGASEALTGLTVLPAATAPETPTAAVTQQPGCGQATGTITVSAPKGDGLFYSVDGATYTNTTGVFTNLAPGNYAVTAKNSCGISASTSLELKSASSVPSTPRASVTQPSCAQPKGSIKVSAPVGSGLSYSIDGLDYSNFSGEFPNLSPGNYNLTVKNSCGISEPLRNIEIMSPPLPPAVPTATVTKQPTCAEPYGVIKINSPIEAGVAYSVDGVDFNNTTGVFNDLVPGTYTIKAKNTCGTSGPSTELVINAAASAPSTPVATVTQQPTCSQPTGTITITAPQGAGISYSIDGTTFNNTNGIFSNLAPGEYKVTVKNECGVSQPLTALLVKPADAAPAKPVATVKQPTCTTLTATVTVSEPKGSGLTYSIDGSDYSNTTGVFTGLIPGSYSLTVKNSCGVSPAVALKIAPPPSAPSQPVGEVFRQPSCTDPRGSIKIVTPTGPAFSYSIDGVDFSNTSGMFENLPAGVYRIHAKNECGSSISPELTLKATSGAPDKPVASVTQQPGCSTSTGTITITAPKGDGLFYSVDGITYSNTTGLFDNLAPGVYKVSAKSSCGISQELMLEVNKPGLPLQPPVVKITQPTCSLETGSIVVTEPTGAGNSFSIDGVNYTNTTGVFSDLIPGEYSLTVKSATGCISDVKKINIEKAAGAPTVELAVTDAACGANTGSVTITAKNGTAPYSYQLDGGDFVTSNSFNGVSPGMHKIIVKDAAGCNSEQSFQLKKKEIPAIAVSPASAQICAGGIQLLTASGGSVYQWYFNGNKIAGATAASYEALEEGVYHVVASNGTCEGFSNEVKITRAAAVVLSITADGASSFCPGGSVLLKASGSTNGYEWYKDGVKIPGAAGATYSATAGGVYKAALAKGAATCPAESNSITVTLLPLPREEIKATSLILCEGSTVKLSATGGASYQWYLDGAVITGAVSDQYETSRAGSYTVEIKNIEGCTGKAPNIIVLQLQKKPKADFITSAVCLNEAAQFSNTTENISSDLTWLWQFGDGNTSTSFSPDHIYNAAGNFSVSLIARSATCAFSDTVKKSIRVASAAKGLQYPVTRVEKNVAFPLEARNLGPSYLWVPPVGLNNPTIRTPMVTIASDQTYKIQITNANGCITVDTLVVKAYDKTEVFVPAAFTPNRNGANDLLRPITVNIPFINYFKIYNRWGQLVYQTAKPGEGWDGRLKGMSQAADTYTWIFEGKDTGGRVIQATGKTILIR